MIAVESDEEIDFYPNLFRAVDPQNPSSNVGYSYNEDALEYPRPEVVLPPSDCEPSENRGRQASGSGENHVFERAEIPEEENDDEENSYEPSRPSKKRNLRHRMEANFYPIDFLKCATTHTDLLKLRNLYDIPEDVLLAILGKGDVPSRPPKRYVTLHLESFKLELGCPFNPTLARYLVICIWILVSYTRTGRGYSQLFCIVGKVSAQGAFPCEDKMLVSTEEQSQRNGLVLLHIELCEEETHYRFSLFM